MRLLPSHIARLLEVIEASPFETHQFVFETIDSGPIVRFKGDPNGTWFSMSNGSGGNYDLTFQPGGVALEERQPALGLQDVAVWLSRWIGFIYREQAARERLDGKTIPPPEWSLAHLPDRYREVVGQLEQLHEEERRLRRMAALLWETGEPLNRVVRDAFRQIGFPAEGTVPGATYDVTVTLPADLARSPSGGCG